MNLPTLQSAVSLKIRVASPCKLIYILGNDFYVCDFKGHCVAVFSETGQFKCRIGSEKVTCFPNGIDISDAGDILIGDSHGNRFHVACYSRNGVLQSEFECPYVKVSGKVRVFNEIDNAFTVSRSLAAAV